MGLALVDAKSPSVDVRLLTSLFKFRAKEGTCALFRVIDLIDELLLCFPGVRWAYSMGRGEAVFFAFFKDTLLIGYLAPGRFIRVAFPSCML